MKRFLVFAGGHYYPNGGWEDFKGSYDSLNEARDTAIGWSSEGDWAQVVDTALDPPDFVKFHDGKEGSKWS